MTGAEQAEMRPDEGIAAPDWLGEPVEERNVPQPAEEPAEPEPDSARPRSAGIRLFGTLLLLLALGWIAAAGWSIWQSRPTLTIANGVSWAATLSGPLILLALLW